MLKSNVLIIVLCIYLTGSSRHITHVDTYDFNKSNLVLIPPSCSKDINDRLLSAIFLVNKKTKFLKTPTFQFSDSHRNLLNVSYSKNSMQLYLKMSHKSFFSNNNKLKK